jgi:hypothetical protein
MAALVKAVDEVSELKFHYCVWIASVIEIYSKRKRGLPSTAVKSSEFR